ncbi:MAG: [dimethylamine--corrinoid protein] Co-methyltransferase [Deltaproteobacteria bacterium]|nr:[dimethylamine--corrinoid protein] Co-methyltransferase [Deltaproteobacteria bacterium]
MQNRVMTHMGDGERIYMSREEIAEDILDGTNDAADRGDIPALTKAEREQLLDIISEPGRVVSVSPGEEVIVTDDACSLSFYADQENSGMGLPMSRHLALLAWERVCCADTGCMGHVDFSYKPVKNIINFETTEYYSNSQATTIPLFYGAQPNMGLYYQPDGPFENPGELMPSGKIAEARQMQVDAAEQMKKDIVFIARELDKVGCEGLNLDTSGSAGDADFFAALTAVKEIKKAAPHMAVELGAASEFILGMHGDIFFEEKRLAGMYPHKQVKMAEDAGVDIFGATVNVNTSESMPWNLARAVTFIKETTRVAKIPVHPNVGMGVCGVPMYEVPPVSAVTRASKALVQIGKADGL